MAFWQVVYYGEILYSIRIEWQGMAMFGRSSVSNISWRLWMFFVSIILEDLKTIIRFLMEIQIARQGERKNRPGLALFVQVKEELGHIDIVADDLGFLTQKVIDMVRDSGFLGMKIL